MHRFRLYVLARPQFRLDLEDFTKGGANGLRRRGQAQLIGYKKSSVSQKIFSFCE